MRLEGRWALQMGEAGRVGGRAEEGRRRPGKTGLRNEMRAVKQHENFECWP